MNKNRLPNETSEDLRDLQEKRLHYFQQQRNIVEQDKELAKQLYEQELLRLHSPAVYLTTDEILAQQLVLQEKYGENFMPDGGPTGQPEPEPEPSRPTDRSTGSTGSTDSTYSTGRPSSYSTSTRHDHEDQNENRRQQVLVNNNFEVRKVREILEGSGSKYDRLKELYKQFPPKMGHRLMELTDEEAENVDKLRKCISLSIKHYHPDQNRKELYGENWAVLSEEICKHLTRFL